MSERDHRKIGSEMELFMFHPDSPGSVIWLDKGEELYHSLSEAMRALVKSNGYKCVRTPLMWKQYLWEISGHWDNYKENIFHWQVDSSEVGLKPMNCPIHMAIFGSKLKTYRDLPYKIYDPGILHRNELSGALGGLTRLRQFSQDDAHIFCSEEQIQEEVIELLDMINGVYGAFDLEYSCKLSTRPENFMGEKELWNKAEGSLRKALEEYQGNNFEVDEGGGAFYGPKIDCHVVDSLGREWQTATIQLDFNLPKRFDLKYRDANDSQRVPVVIHRALLGSYERFLALLLEHYNGKFPVWLAPEQIRILSISEKSAEYAKEVHNIVREFRSEVDNSSERLGKKIAEARKQRVPLLFIVGEKEAESNMVSVRHRDRGDLGLISIDSLYDFVKAEDYFRW